ncbi:MAG TPA: polyprenyl synthetase family protein [Sulfurovum sp.]|jgi:farnesyl diphosphate synthase|nr:MAG: geranyl transferase [Sulfurovum sp. 35-42-20]OYY55978.1 MAG: geranyl transferase [Sulfurovum sp. 28-43-6]OYZ26333.1 MAG: geranyl transferase [Sulfurovum sp. 16-42-52]OYZ48807.1 MAG: geranyl transferase [Sulfurovum sp. 24-42-9]OZA46489.1 MAG: geranyl transferase [Sulfurovum sp. 17-42-90]OZA59091.1 MAG: geranyl transferase [Sulfurovum sp. 39-42-12]HQR74252.1 polyprenyl synthetase family protein [Sulfurovum sp.]
MQRFEQYLRDNLPHVESFHPIYEEALGAMLLAGGKRFRPMLLLRVVDAYEPLLYDSALPVALALEMFHTYSLIHDDLPAMDDAPLRRGHATLHTRYDEVTAILAGDALNTDAFYLIAKAPLRADVKIKLIELLSRDGGSRGMVLGQAIDCYFENKPLTLEQIKTLHTNKTAKLIAVSLQMGAVIVGLEKKVQDALYDFGLDLGLLFQIQDDIIDETQSEEEAGKTTGIDGNKNSFVTLLGLEQTVQEADVLAKALQRRFEDFDLKLQTALQPLMQQYLNRHH